jgi:DNA polymerase III epsilon subunit-like protein
MTLDLSTPWHAHKILAVDFEATSADALTCEPVEVACTLFEYPGNIVGRFVSFLRTKEPIPQESTDVHGITTEMVADAPTLGELGPQLAEIAQGAVPMAFNRKYDRTVMHRYLTGAGVPLFDPAQAWLCTAAMAWFKDRYVAGKGRHRLAECCKRRGINIVGAHRAEADTIMAGRLFYALMEAAKRDLSMARLLDSIDEIECDRDADRVKFEKQIREQERVIWREYARVMSRHDLTTTQVAARADEMLQLERERFL